MSELWCAVYGEGKAFPVTVKLDSCVSVLQEAIFYKKRYNRQYDFDSSALTLYVAQRPDGTWLLDDDDTERLLERRGVGPTFKKMRASWNLRDDYMGVAFKPAPKEIHILVELPKPPQATPTRTEDPKIRDLDELMWRRVLLNAPSSTSARSTDFKANLVAAYDCQAGRGMLRCMLLDTALPSPVVIASHLFRRSNEFCAEMMLGISDIDDVRNGLLLFKPLEHAFDHFQITFLYNKTEDVYRMKVFDPSIRSTRLFDTLDGKQRGILLNGHTLPTNWESSGPTLAPGTTYDLQTTFGDLEDKPLCFTTIARPFKRCLNFQARLARKKAIEEEWIQPEEDFEDFGSDEMTLEEKMAFFRAHDVSSA